MNRFKTSIENLEVTEDARFFNALTGKEIKTFKNKSTGYWQTTFQSKVITVHRIMCETFHGSPEGDAKFVGHTDDNPDNNHKDNLKWLTRKENNASSSKARLLNGKETQLTTEQLDDMVDTYLTGNYTLTGITNYMNEKYNRKSSKPTYYQNLRGQDGVSGKRYWALQSAERLASVLAITASNKRNHTI